ncbi:MAG: hypothetical protein M0R51_13930 [Clostridia bacterium]|jgi:hypothetical protein|nr:hypothetical protein [Clostridia bacterium]
MAGIFKSDEADGFGLDLDRDGILDIKRGSDGKMYYGEYEIATNVHNFAEMYISETQLNM